jgi:hypothetical protein
VLARSIYFDDEFRHASAPYWPTALYAALALACLAVGVWGLR